MSKSSKSKKRRQRRTKQLRAKATPVIFNPDVKQTEYKTEAAQEPVRLGQSTPVIFNPDTTDTKLNVKDSADAARRLVEKALRRLKNRRRKKVGVLPIDTKTSGEFPEPSTLTETQRQRLENCRAAMRLINEQLESVMKSRARAIIPALQEAARKLAQEDF